MGLSIGALKQRIKALSNVHLPGKSPNVFLFSMPRSGSTWLMELICSQPGFKYCNEPLDLREPLVAHHLGIDDWGGLYSPEATAKIERYFADLQRGKLGFLNPNPLGRHYRPITHRMVFKMIDGCEGRMNWFRDTFRGRVVYLLRHPIAVSVSREAYPTVAALLESEHQRHFTPRQLDLAHDVLRGGTDLERKMVSWCVQNRVALQEMDPHWAVVSYEQLVVDPVPVIRYLCGQLALPNPEAMMRGLEVPSLVKYKSDRETQRLLEQREADRRRELVEKWRKKVSHEEERAAMGLVDRFGIDFYRFGEVLPAERVWISEPTGSVPLGATVAPAGASGRG